MNELFEVIALPFIQNAIVAGVFIGFICSYFGVFIVQRKMSFLGDGLAHAAFGGVALALLLNQEPLWLAIPFTILVSVSITLLNQRTKLSIDTSIGIFFAVSVALGIVFISLNKQYSVDAFTYLFGSILSVSKTDLIISSILAVATILTIPRLWAKWAYSTFDSELARADGVAVRRDDFILSVFISVSIVVSIKLLGIVLVASFLVIPAATARLLTRTFVTMTILSVILGTLSSICGLFFSLLLDLPSGATIILSQAFFFFAALPFKKE